MYVSDGDASPTRERMLPVSGDFVWSLTLSRRRQHGRRVLLSQDNHITVRTGMYKIEEFVKYLNKHWPEDIRNFK